MALGSVYGATAAHADPAWGSASHPFVAVGSNTIEDLGDAFSGIAPTPGDAASASNYHSFTPLADPGSGEQIYSWDAVNQATNATDCISTKPGDQAIARPNGSGDGQKAISDAIQGVAWSKASSTCASAIPSGFIDIGRSSSPPSGAACTFGAQLCLAWVDIAHDAVSYAYTVKTGTTLDATQTTQTQQLTNAELTSLYGNTTTGTLTVGTGAEAVTYAACLPQLGSGTEKFFVNNELNGGAGLTGGTTTAEAAATAAHCINFEENGADTFQTTGQAGLTTDATDSPAPVVAVTPFSGGSWISQANGFAFQRSAAGIAAGVTLGTIDGATLGSVFTGTAPNLVPNPTFYDSTLYGRDLYMEMNNASLNGSSLRRSTPLEDIFGYVALNYAGASGTVGVPATGALPDGNATPQICSTPYTTELSQFGFVSPTIHACAAETFTVLTTGTGS
jgi:hypothetical protein